MPRVLFQGWIRDTFSVQPGHTTEEQPKYTPGRVLELSLEDKILQKEGSEAGPGPQACNPTYSGSNTGGSEVQDLLK